MYYLCIINPHNSAMKLVLSLSHFIDALIQRIFINDLPCASHYSRWWIYCQEKIRLPHGTESLAGEGE